MHTYIYILSTVPVLARPQLPCLASFAPSPKARGAVRVAHRASPHSLSACSPASMCVFPDRRIIFILMSTDEYTYNYKQNVGPRRNLRQRC